MPAVFALCLAALATMATADSRGVTPHDIYSSSVGVLGMRMDLGGLDGGDDDEFQARLDEVGK